RHKRHRRQHIFFTLRLDVVCAVLSASESAEDSGPCNQTAPSVVPICSRGSDLSIQPRGWSPWHGFRTEAGASARARVRQGKCLIKRETSTITSGASPS